MSKIEAYLAFDIVKISCLLLWRQIGNIKAFCYGLASILSSSASFCDNIYAAKSTLAENFAHVVPAQSL